MQEREAAQTEAVFDEDFVAALGEIALQVVVLEHLHQRLAQPSDAQILPDLLYDPDGVHMSADVVQQP